jgi:hypothetical protein
VCGHGHCARRARHPRRAPGAVRRRARYAHGPPSFQSCAELTGAVGQMCAPCLERLRACMRTACSPLCPRCALGARGRRTHTQAMVTDRDASQDANALAAGDYELYRDPRAVNDRSARTLHGCQLVVPLTSQHHIGTATCGTPRCNALHAPARPRLGLPRHRHPLPLRVHPNPPPTRAFSANRSRQRLVVRLRQCLHLRRCRCR